MTTRFASPEAPRPGQAPAASPRPHGRLGVFRAAAWLGRMLFVVGLWLATPPLHAQSDALVVEPNPAPAGAALRLHFVDMNAYCSGFQSSRVERDGFTITLRADFTYGLCGTPPPGDLMLPLGSYGPGRYTLIYRPFLLGVEQPGQTLGFEVYPTVTTVPTLGHGALAAMLALIVALGLGALPRRR
jgi:hypothetical protein